MKKIILFCIILLNGCLGRTPDSQFYLLGTPLSAPVISEQTFNIAVSTITIPAYVDRPQIVMQKPDSPELDISEFNRWASDLNLMLQNTLIENMQIALPQATIKPLAYGDTSQYILTVNITKIGGWFQHFAYIKGCWQVSDFKGNIIATGHIREQTPVGSDYISYVNAISRMWQSFAYKLATKTITLN